MGTQPAVVFGVGLSEISGVDTLHCVLASGLMKLGFQCSFIGFGGHSENGLDFPPGASVNLIAPPKPWFRLAFPRTRDWQQYLNRRNQRIAHAQIMAQRPVVLIAGHIGNLWMKPTPGVIQMGVVHADDAGNRRILETYGSCWDATVAVGPDAARLMESMASCLPRERRQILNGVHRPDSIDPSPGDPLVILCCGRLAQRQKRILDLPAIAARLDDRQRIHFLVAGDGPDRNTLWAEIARLKMDARIDLLGKISQSAAREQMDAADVVLLLSEYEGTPMVLIEAMARGCVPLSSTGCGGVLPLLRQHFPDCLFTPGDIDHYARQLGTLAESPTLVAKLKTKAWHAIGTSEHTLERMTQGYADLIIRLAS